MLTPSDTHLRGEWVKIRVAMNRVQGLLVAVITGLTLLCVGLIVAVARSNASGGSGGENSQKHETSEMNILGFVSTTCLLFMLVT